MSFYEDVELAVRLRQRGFESMVVPTARALHQGGATSRTISRESDRWRYSHRYLVLARLSGRRFWTRSILLALRDALDTGHSLLDPRGAKPVDVFRGWWRAARLVRHFIHLGRAYEGDGSFPIRVRKAASWPSMWNEDH
jgi:GT2 family glycosyltransferase